MFLFIMGKSLERITFHAWVVPAVMIQKVSNNKNAPEDIS